MPKNAARMLAQYRAITIFHYGTQNFPEKNLQYSKGSPVSILSLRAAPILAILGLFLFSPNFGKFWGAATSISQNYWNVRMGWETVSSDIK